MIHTFEIKVRVNMFPKASWKSTSTISTNWMFIINLQVGIHVRLPVSNVNSSCCMNFCYWYFFIFISISIWLQRYILKKPWLIRCRRTVVWFHCSRLSMAAISKTWIVFFSGFHMFIFENSSLITSMRAIMRLSIMIWMLELLYDFLLDWESCD